MNQTDVDVAERHAILLRATRDRLLASRSSRGSFVGELSLSPLSTATAVIALAMIHRCDALAAPIDLVHRGGDWLARNLNDDGGFGDTLDSPSNVSTTTLAWVALGLLAEMGGEAAARFRHPFERAQGWLESTVGSTEPHALSAALRRRYGKDLTFSIPILTTCVIGGRFGSGRNAWCFPHLPFELAALPRRWFRWLGIPMVSYALPALIALGQVRHHHAPTWNPITRLGRRLARGRTLRVLEAIQPDGGGFLEATPLTSFVLMSLASMGETRHPVVTHGVEFLVASIRDDGGWPIDTNLDTWTTSLAIAALATDEALEPSIAATDRQQTIDWLLEQQYLDEHPYTGAAPGGFAWTDLPGGVPDADDTPGGLIALWHLSGGDASRLAGGNDGWRDRVELACGWLLDLQNRDGGIPTFCRGFGVLPFDRSSPDLTAHTLRAWKLWRDEVSETVRARIDVGRRRAIAFLLRSQRADGTWIPLWFGNQRQAEEENPLWGTAQVVRALSDADIAERVDDAVDRAVASILSARNDDGGFGAGPGVASSIEETGLAALALSSYFAKRGRPLTNEVRDGIVNYLWRATDEGSRYPPAPIGLYFAKLWYHEQLYPVIFSYAGLAALRRVSLER